MTSPPARSRPLSPHLGIYHRGPHMIVSIVHRITGDGLATVGTLVLLAWLGSAALGADSYGWFTGLAWSLPGKIVLVALTWAFFQHLFSGLRHLILDTGAGYDLAGNRMSSILVFALAIVATGLVWGAILMRGL